MRMTLVVLTGLTLAGAALAAQQVGPPSSSLVIVGGDDRSVSSGRATGST